jgi:transposase InsO family protein
MARSDLVRTPFRSPKANGYVERLIGSIRRECLDHFIILSEDHLRQVLKEYVVYYNNCRPHQGIQQRIPLAPKSHAAKGTIRFRAVLNGLHHHYYRNAG